MYSYIKGCDSNMELERAREYQEEPQSSYQEHNNQTIFEKRYTSLEALIRAKFEHGDQLLKVYVDREEDRFYIDTFAAYALGMLTYKDASERFDLGTKYLEISRPILELLQRVFKDRIEYVEINLSKKSEYHIENSIDGSLRGNDIDNIDSSSIDANDNKLTETKDDKSNYDNFSQEDTNEINKMMNDIPQEDIKKYDNYSK